MPPAGAFTAGPSTGERPGSKRPPPLEYLAADSSTEGFQVPKAVITPPDTYDQLTYAMSLSIGTADDVSPIVVEPASEGGHM